MDRYGASWYSVWEFGYSIPLRKRQYFWQVRFGRLLEVKPEYSDQSGGCQFFSWTYWSRSIAPTSLPKNIKIGINNRDRTQIAHLLLSIVDVTWLARLRQGSLCWHERAAVLSWWSGRLKHTSTAEKRLTLKPVSLRKYFQFQNLVHLVRFCRKEQTSGRVNSTEQAARGALNRWTIWWVRWLFYLSFKRTSDIANPLKIFFKNSLRINV